MHSRRKILKTLHSCIVFSLGSTVLATALSTPAFAHRQKLTLTDIRWKSTRPEKDKIYSLGDTSGTLEIVHSFHIHEAEIALSETYGLKNPDLTRLETQARLALYTHKNFDLALIDKTPLKLELIGADQDRQTVYVYQQISLTERPEGLIVNCQLFRDLSAPLINNVDVQIAKMLHSLQFKGAAGPKKILA